MQLYVIIPVYNRCEMTDACLESIFRQDTDDVTVIVVDDGSTDGTSEMLRIKYPDVIVEYGNGDLWWTGATNKGIRYVLDVCQPEDYVLLLNIDLVLHNSYLESVRKMAEIQPNSLIGSVVVDFINRESIVSGGVQINWKNAKVTDLNRGKKLSSFPADFCAEVSTLTGRGVLIPIRMFRENGLYKSHYQQCGDYELPVRAARAGYRLLVAYSMIVYNHPKNKTSINEKEKYRLHDVPKYFFGVHSNFRIRYRFWFALDTATSLWGGIRFFLIDTIRNIGHFIKNLTLYR